MRYRPASANRTKEISPTFPSTVTDDHLISLSQNAPRIYACEWLPYDIEGRACRCPAFLGSFDLWRRHVIRHCAGAYDSQEGMWRCNLQRCPWPIHDSCEALEEHVSQTHVTRNSLFCPVPGCVEKFRNHRNIPDHIRAGHDYDDLGSAESLSSPSHLQPPRVPEHIKEFTQSPTFRHFPSYLCSSPIARAFQGGGPLSPLPQSAKRSPGRQIRRVSKYAPIDDRSTQENGADRQSTPCHELQSLAALKSQEGSLIAPGVAFRMIKQPGEPRLSGPPIPAKGTAIHPGPQLLVAEGSGQPQDKGDRRLHQTPRSKPTSVGFDVLWSKLQATEQGAAIKETVEKRWASGPSPKRAGTSIKALSELKIADPQVKASLTAPDKATNPPARPRQFGRKTTNNSTAKAKRAVPHAHMGRPRSRSPEV